MKKNLKKFMALILALVMVFSMGLSALAEETADGQDQVALFDEFMWRQFKESVESDYLTMHYLVEDPSAYGFAKPELTLGNIFPETYADSIEENQAVLAEMETFDYDQLLPSQQAAYDTMKFILENIIIMDQYPEFDEMFNPYSGALDNYITNFTEFRFRTQEEVDDYLVLLADLPRLIDDMITVTLDQAARGFFMPDSALEEELDSLQEFVDKGEENPLIVIFHNNLAQLGLSEEEVSAYEETNRDIVINQIFPKYLEAKAQLEPLQGSRSVKGGICYYPGGSEYYAALARYRSSTNMTIQEIYDLAEACYDKGLDFWFDVDHPGRYYEDLDFASAEDVLVYLTGHMNGLPEAVTNSYEVSYLDPSVATPSVVAYYMEAPIDNLHQNVIRINGDAVGEDVNELYMTLAHEGYPGHLYQGTYYLASDTFYPLMHMLSNLGFQEGWAMYAEHLMLRNSNINNYSYSYLEVDNFLNYVSNVCMEIGVNGFGWTEQEMLDFLDPEGDYYALEDMTDTCEYFQALPGTLISYGFGECMFLTLRARAMVSLGTAFDEVEFHEVLLNHGSRIFDVAERELEQYVNSKGYVYETDPLAYDEYLMDAVMAPYTGNAVSSPLAPEEGHNTMDQDIIAADSTEAGIETETKVDDGKSNPMAAIAIAAILIVVAIILTIVFIATGKKKKAKKMQEWAQQPQAPQMPQYQQPQAPQMPQYQQPQAPQMPQYQQPQAPQMPQYQQPQAPQMPQYQQPQAPQMPQYQQPQAPQMPQYQQPQAPQMPQYQQPQAPQYPQYQQPQAPQGQNPYQQ